jgi:hypothetical protein
VGTVMINTSNASVSFSRAIVRARHRRSRRASDPTRFERNRPESLPRAPRPFVISRQIRAQLSHSRSGRVQMHLHRYLTHGRSRRPFAARLSSARLSSARPRLIILLHPSSFITALPLAVVRRRDRRLRRRIRGRAQARRRVLSAAFTRGRTHSNRFVISTA